MSDVVKIAESIQGMTLVELIKAHSDLMELLEAHRRFHGKAGCPGCPGCYVCELEARR